MGDPVKPFFVNNLQFSGFLNGVINMSFTQAHWFTVPAPDTPEGVKMSGEDIPALDLRLDLNCAQQIVDGLTKIIAQNTKPKVTN